MHWLFWLCGSAIGVFLLGKPTSPLSTVALLPVWVGLGVAVELLSPRLPRFGFIGAGPVLWLGLMSSAPQAGLAAVFGCAAGLLLRLGRSAQPGGWGLMELASDLQPVALALGLAHAMGKPWAAPLIWFFLWWFQPALLSSAALDEEVHQEWLAYRARMTRVGLGLALLSLLPGWLQIPNAGPLGVLAGVALSLAYSARFVVTGVDADSQTTDRRRRERGLNQREVGLERMHVGLQETDRKQKRTAAELEVRLETYQLMDQMLEAIPRSPVFQAVADLLVERIYKRLGFANTLLYWQRDAQWQPLAFLTPHPDRVAAAPLTQVQEPIVGRALQTGEIQIVPRAQASDDRLFPEDVCCVAVPIGSGSDVRGAFYLGDPRPHSLSEEDLHFLAVLARRSVLALESAAWYQTLQTSLQREGATAARNEALVQRLAQVIDGVTQLIRLRDPVAMLRHTGHVLKSLVPHEHFYAFSGEVEVGQTGEQGVELAALARQVSTQGLPLLLESPVRLAIPMVHDGGQMGALVLARSQPHFVREDQDILSVLSYQLTSALVTAQLYAELHKAHDALRESQAQLVQSSKMAAIGQLAGGVAHELNTPLGAIALAVEAAQMNLQNKPERAQARLERASKAVQQMKEIVSKLLFYARDSRSGWRQTHVNEIIEDTLQLIGHQLRLDGIEVVQQFGEVPSIQANPNELQQVFINLMINARDAMLSPGAAGKRLLITTGGVEGGCWVRILDQGCGIPQDVAQRIFEPFFTTKEVGKGTGLGLSVTAQLLQQHGGTVTVQSQPGRGTQFEVRLLTAPPETE